MAEEQTPPTPPAEPPAQPEVTPPAPAQPPVDIVKMLDGILDKRIPGLLKSALKDNGGIIPAGAGRTAIAEG